VHNRCRYTYCQCLFVITLFGLSFPKVCFIAIAEIIGIQLSLLKASDHMFQAKVSSSKCPTQLLLALPALSPAGGASVLSMLVGIYIGRRMVH